MKVNLSTLHLNINQICRLNPHIVFHIHLCNDHLIEANWQIAQEFLVFDGVPCFHPQY